MLPLPTRFAGVLVAALPAASAGEETGPAAIFLEDSDQHPRLRRRFELTAEAVSPHAPAVVRVETVGETRVERLLIATRLNRVLTVEPSPSQA